MAEMFQFKDNLVAEMQLSSALKYRKVYFNDEFNQDSCFKAMYLLNRLEELDKKTGTKDDIEIIVNSFGGMIYSGLQLISTICRMKDMGYKIITTVNGVTMSMGFMLAIISSERRCTRYSTYLCHQPSSATWGTLKDMEANVEETKRLWNLMKDIIKEHTLLTDEELDRIYIEKEDKIYTPKQALELGICDIII